MKLTSEMIEKIKEIADEFCFDYEVIGVRVQEQPFELGELSHVSHVWDDGEDTGAELDGVCVVKADFAGKCHQYFGDHAAVIAGNRYTYGEDPGEIIIEDPIVVEVLA